MTANAKLRVGIVLAASGTVAFMHQQFDAAAMEL
jgi:hypothetical protein